MADGPIYMRNDAVPSGEVDGELVALDMEKGDCFGLDRIGTDIWRLAAVPVSLEAIVDELTQRYDVDAATCRRDIEPFLGDMVEAGLLRRE